MLGKNLIQAATGAAGDDVLGVEDVFSTWLYTGNGSTQTIPNGIDLDGEGGMVWLKQRNTAREHFLFDTQRGVNNYLYIATQAQITNPDHLTSFNSDGFLLGSSGNINQSTGTYASWTFRKAEKFFDVVTYTGTGVARTVPHNLGSVPGCIIVKRTDTTSNWAVYHISNGITYWQALNTTDAKMPESGTFWNATTPTSTVFSVGIDSAVNASGGTYVAYLFAHDAGGFGDSGDESVIKCGSYTAAYPNSPVIDLGWEPQWILIKGSGQAGTWAMFDTMRGMAVSDTGGALLYANNSNQEQVGADWVIPTATGFIVDPRKQGYALVNPDSSATFIYIAIRRGPMKKPTDATKVFDDVAYTGSAAGTARTTGFPVDMQILSNRAFTRGSVFDRLRGISTNNTNAGQNLYTTDTATESSISYTRGWNNTGFLDSGSWVGSNMITHNFRRAPGFFDVVAYTGTGVARTVPHNLGVAPELMIVKRRNTVGNWCVYSAPLGATKAVYLNYDFSEQTDSTFWNNTAPTDAVFTLGTNSNLNQASSTHIAYLFATLPGVSKVGSYTGTGTTLNIDCGFAAGARFVLIKRTDSTGDWYVWDTARGIVSGNDPHLRLNAATAEITNTDYIDPLASGFQITSTAPAAINASGGSYIFLAIA